MHTLTRSVHIDAEEARVHAALTQGDGYRGWWCANSAIADWVGGRSMLHFLKDGEPVTMVFRVEELQPRSVAWTCVENDAPPWVGTTLSWKLTPSEDGVDVGFEHGGWPAEPPQMIADTWDHFLGSLKSFVENGTGQPW